MHELNNSAEGYIFLNAKYILFKHKNPKIYDNVVQGTKNVNKNFQSSYTITVINMQLYFFESILAIY